MVAKQTAIPKGIAVLGGSDAESGARGARRGRILERKINSQWLSKPRFLWNRWPLRRKPPAPGYRRFDNNGTLYAVGHFGYGWASSVVATGHAHNLNFNETAIYPQNHHYRAHGFQVRCLQE